MPLGLATMLTPSELRVCELIAAERNTRARNRGGRPIAGQAVGDTREGDYVGLRGELGTAKLLDCYPNFKTYAEEIESGGYDLSYRVCVRAFSAPRGGLLIRPGDDNTGRYVCAHVNGAYVTLIGWDEAGNVKHPQWRRSPNGRPPCFIKPPRELLSMQSLLVEIGIDRLDAVLADGV